ncbi:MAG: hypothetical protein AAGA60_30125 [Cyanobacteria bacterium P01_E01_bin.42]
MTITIFDFKIDLLLVAFIFILTFFIGLSKGLITNIAARLRVKNNPEIYQIFKNGEYISLEYGTDKPLLLGATLFGISYDFVIVEKSQEQVISETFYSFFGDVVKTNYLGEQFQTSQSLSSPLHTITALFPFLFGFVGSFVTSLLLYNIKENLDPSVQEFWDAIVYYSIHLCCAGLLSDIFLFVIPREISMWRKLAKKNESFEKE